MGQPADRAAEAKAGELVMAITLPLADGGVFDQWAEVYDTQSNPLLRLEERTAAPLLPKVEGADVLDFGCGTGRWLTRFEAMSPATLLGVDCSEGMLEHAREKVSVTTRLVCGGYAPMPVASCSVDLIMASFVLSYVSDLEAFARECSRVCRPGAYLLLSDMHAVTAAERGWTRSFLAGGSKVELEIEARETGDILSVFQEHGFDLRTRVDAVFEEPECVVFEQAGKLAEFEALVGVPAISIFLLQQRSRSSAARVKACGDVYLHQARYSAGAAAWKEGGLLIEDGRIASMAVLKDDLDPDTPMLDLSGYVVLPGLINAHDHLEFGLFPRLGRRANEIPYSNSVEWAEKIHRTERETIRRHRQVPKESRLWWGVIRNVLCGVTSVCHHNPAHACFADPEFPVRVLTDFGWAHSLAFDEHAQAAFRSNPADQPFVLHAAEGVDKRSREEILRLDALGMLDGRTVLVHGLALGMEEVELLNRRGASLITCPSSNQFLFGQQLSGDVLGTVERGALGSDSPLTARGDLLDELRFLSGDHGIDAKRAYSMVTSSPAEMFHLRDGEGSISRDGVANLIALRKGDGSPADVLARATFAEVELVMLGGRVSMASDAMFLRLPEALRTGMQRLAVAGHGRWLRAPLDRLFASAEEILGEGCLSVGGKEVRYAEAV